MNSMELVKVTDLGQNSLRRWQDYFRHQLRGFEGEQKNGSASRIHSAVTIMSAEEQVFSTFNLEPWQLAGAAVVACAVFIASAAVATRHLKDRYRLAWVSSMVNAGVMTVASVAYWSLRWSTNSSLFLFANGREVFHGVDNFSAVVCVWFGVANVFDIVFGMLCYREHLKFLTSYFHHAFYVWLMVLATTGQGGFLKVTPFASCFTLLVIEEFPVLLLSIGNVFPSISTDLSFGASWFCLRLVFHAYCLIYAVWSGVDAVLLGILLFTLLLHIYWFCGFMPYLWELIVEYLNSRRDEKME